MSPDAIPLFFSCGIICGKMVVPAAAYKSFSISWTCVKPSADEVICSDFALVVDTRRPFPSPHTLKTIDANLKKPSGLSLTDMVKYQHTNGITANLCAFIITVSLFIFSSTG